MTARRPSRLVRLWPCFFAAGCAAIGPNYRTPRPALAPAYGEIDPAARAAGIEPDAASLTRWWTVFGDAELNSLIDRAVRENRDLKQAVSRVRQARAQRGIVAAGLWPEVDATAGYDRARGSKNVVIPFSSLAGSSGAASSGASSSSGGAPSTRSVHALDEAPASAGASSGPSAPPASPFGEGGLPGVTTSLYQAGFDASWEIDLFGGTRRAIEAAKAEIGVAEESGHSVLISLLSEVASDYVDLRTVQERLKIERESLSSQRDALAIAEARFQAGLATRLEVAQQSAQVASTAAAIPLLESAERAGLHALAFLIGQEPDALVAELKAPGALPPLPPRVPVGIPSDLLRRRPDIRGAERQLAAATAEVGVAKAAMFPTFSLTGVFGWDSSQAKNLPDWASHYYSIAPGIDWPILDWGRVRANIRVQNELQRQSVLNYENTVSRALKEVEDALVNYENERVRRSALADGVAASREAWTIARQKYAHGLTDMTTALQAEGSLLASRDALAQSDSALRTDLIALYKALGGGWEL